MKKILIVDDEPDLCFYIKRALDRTGEYSAVATTQPEEAFSLCQSEKPNLIILDVVMPNLKGTEILKTIKENPETQQMLVIITSGLGEMVYSKGEDKWKWEANRPIVWERGDVIQERSAEKAAAAYGVDDFLAKPFSPSTLLAVVRDVFARSEKSQSPDGTSGD
jgi:DNA-binding response OmpR family regulator